MKLNKDFDMSSRSSRRLSGLCASDGLPQLPPRKRPGYWSSQPQPAVSCANAPSFEVRSVTLAEIPSIKDPGAVYDQPFRKKRKCVLLEGELEEAEQVTRDLCTSFQNVESTESRKMDVVAWRSTTSSPNGPQSGTTNSEGVLERHDNDINNPTDTVRNAAQLLTQLICGRNVNNNGQSPDILSSTPFTRDARQGLDLPIRWGVRKKVSYENRRGVDSCDLGLSTGLIRRFSYDQEKASAVSADRAPDQKCENGFELSGSQDLQVTAKKWDQSTSPDYPASSEFYRGMESSGEAGISSSLLLTGVTPHGPREKRNKLPLANRTCPGYILRLPREMQGRWSSERFVDDSDIQGLAR